MKSEQGTQIPIFSRSPLKGGFVEAIHFPETPIYKIEVPGFNDVWLKDESINEHSGTHKDRLAWDAANLYRGMLRGRTPEVLPQISIISSGSAAIAIGRIFEKLKLPKLKVLSDYKINETIRKAMEKAHCEVFTTNLSEKALTSKEILAQTDNVKGLELTSHKDIAIDIGSFDAMSFDILNQSPDYIFTPFGTGTTFKKILTTAENILTLPNTDFRYRGDYSKLGECHHMGAITLNPDSSADKLYSPFLPFTDLNEDGAEFYKRAGYCGLQTGVYPLEESFLQNAMAIADKQGIACEPSGIAGLALLLQMQNQIPKDKKILIVNTGKLKL